MLVLLRNNLSLTTAGADTRVFLGDTGETGRQKLKEQISKSTQACFSMSFSMKLLCLPSLFQVILLQHKYKGEDTSIVIYQN